jgi:undecaprenyl-diphosphatase
VLADGPLRRWDETAGDALRSSTPPREVAELLADLGNLSVALPLLAVAMALALRHSRGRGWWPVLCYALALGVMAPLVSGLKAWADRTGPLGGGGFFPSGHAATSAVALGAAALLLTGLLPAVAVRAVWAAVAALTVGNGLGLVWRGYHWPLDVAASWCLGVLLLTVATAAAGHRAPLSGRGLIRR